MTATAADEASVRYHAPPPGTLRLVPLDALTALHHRASGQTHLVAAPMPEILEALEQAPATRAELLDRLAERYTLDDGDTHALAARLAELVTLGLVERG